MTEITRVPLRPIAKGSLTRLWLGVAAAVALAGGLAWAAAPHGVEVEVLAEGSGAAPGPDDVVFVKYVGKLASGEEFDRSRPLPPQLQGFIPEGMPVEMNQKGGMIAGFEEALKDVRKGGRYVWHIPADKAYGATPPPGAPIPPNADLVFDIEVTDILTRPDVERRAMMLQQMMQQQQQQQQGGGQNAPPSGAPRDPGAPQ